jgi:hydrogenase nickel incorporation protein HypA/HybF
MHEVAIMSDIIRAALAELGKHDVTAVEEMVLVVGDLTSLGEDQLTFAYEVMTKDTLLEGSRLVVEHEGVVLSCPSCGYDGPAATLESDYREHTVPILSCPECGGSVKVTAGEACRISSLKVIGG